METVTVEEMQRDLRAYLQRVEAGETLVIVEADRQLAEIKPLPQPLSGPRPFGLAAGEFTVADDFDDPLPDDILRLFEGR